MGWVLVSVWRRVLQPLVNCDHMTGMLCLLTTGCEGREGLRKERKRFNGNKHGWVNKKPQAMGGCWAAEGE